MDIRADVAIQVAPARPLPPDWDAWRAHLTGGAPLEELYTAPHGWSVSIAETAGVLHAFYSVLDQAIHARVVLPLDASAEQKGSVRAALRAATPIWPTSIVALVDV
jgi:hypothetical protein